MADSDPVIVTAVFTPNPGQSDAVLDRILAVIPQVHDEPGCELYSINRAPDGTLTMIEKWASQALLDAHSAGQNLATLAESLDGMLAEPLAVTFMTPVPCGHPVKGAL